MWLSFLQWSSLSGQEILWGTTRGRHVLIFRINSKNHWKLFLDFDFLSFLSFLSFSCLSCNCLGACSCASKGEFREDVFYHIRREDLPMSLRGPFKCDHCDKMCKTNIYLGSTWNPSTSPVRILSSPHRYHQPLEDQKEYAPLTLLSWVRVTPWIRSLQLKFRLLQWQ